MFRKILVLAAAAALFSAPALAQRGGGHGPGGGGHQGGPSHGSPGHGSGGGSWGGNHGPSGGGSWGGGGHGGGWDRHDDHHDWDRGWGGSYRSYNSFALGLTLGGLLDPYPYGYDSYRTYSYAPPAWNSWGLAPYECRWDTEFGYWHGRPADLQVRRCADAYGNVYVVRESQRLWRYR